MATEAGKLTSTAKKDNASGIENPKKTMEPTPTNLDRSEDTPKAALSADSSAPDGKGKDGEDSKTTGAKVGSVAGDDAPVTDTQKKIRRAERFGMPVQLSEEEKRNSRAERFGTGPTLQGSEALKKSEELKRKARAERFGLPVQSASIDEEAKKKARLARFGGDSKTDSLEEDKRKARAIRFSKPVSSSSSELNSEGNIQHRAAIAGKAVGGA